MKNLVIVKTGYPLSSRIQAYRTFFRMGWSITLIDTPFNQGASVSDNSIILPNLNDPEIVIDSIIERIGKPDAVLTFNDSGLLLSAQIAEYFNLHHISVETATNVIDKSLQYQVLDNYSIPLPAWEMVEDETKLKEFISQHNVCVIKPADRSASAGVKLVKNLADAKEAISLARKESPSNKVLIEEFVDGPEFSVETIAINGNQHVVSITRKKLGPQPGFVELGHSLPADLPDHIASQLKETATSATKALNLTFGICHVELKITSDGPKIIEVNARPAGDRIFDLINLAFGIDMYALYIRMASNDSLTLDDIRPSFSRFAAIRASLNPPGFLESVKVTNFIPDQIFDYGFYGEPGMKLLPPNTNGGRGKFAIAWGDSESVASAYAEKALDNFELVTNTTNLDNGE